jgi:hypothetical protein
VSAVAGWLASGVGGGAALVVVLQPGLLGPILVIAGVLGGLPLLLITTLALVAVYSRDHARRVAAEKILNRLLTTLRPPRPSTRTPRPRPSVDQ